MFIKFIIDVKGYYEMWLFNIVSFSCWIAGISSNHRQKTKSHYSVFSKVHDQLVITAEGLIVSQGHFRLLGIQM